MATIKYRPNADSPWQTLVGIKGQDGKTPVRGVDYWTTEDQEAIVNDILSKIENLEEVSF